MNKKKITTTAAVLMAVATFVTSSHALTSSQVQDIKKTVLGVPVPEMPAKAAELVTKAQKKDRQAVAVTAVKAIVFKHRAAAPLVVSAISKAAPDLAPVVAVAAAEMAKEQAPSIARAASVAAPTMAAQISTAVSTAAPAKAAAIRAGTRLSAHHGDPSEGNIVISDDPINPTTGGGGNGQFPQDPPAPAPDPVVIYNQPPAN